MSDMIEDFEIGEVMAKISSHAIAEVCRVADKCGISRNGLVEKFAEVLALSVAVSDFTNMALEGETQE